MPRDDIWGDEVDEDEFDEIKDDPFEHFDDEYECPICGAICDDYVDCGCFADVHYGRD